MAEAAEAAGMDAKVPTCPDWRVRDLLRHTGEVHRWAAMIVAERLAQRPTGEKAASVRNWPEDDAALLDWFREGHARLVDVLATADLATECWSFHPAPSPVEFWARRQAHETTVHRIDAEVAGRGATPVSAGFAADGVDEILCNFFTSRNPKVTAEPSRTMAVRAVDTGDAWLATIGPEGVATVRGYGTADCTVTGNASDLYALLWNRRGTTGITVAGDASVLELWRTDARVL
ncbi:hypothetical protein AC529_15895 [Thermobifida cellulosilytica TB100]|uniref:Mycothiol-dependent maleylpyruvate isomerase metal-binding domain-containing protein n=2 Tax=Thermobifida cellulosilytica TaxID=144786 RepID=A0A147KEN6_THECS|nr:hypothetical protein AC529_15895 [Thermobifida cellulosilytica TB100]